MNDFSAGLNRFSEFFSEFPDRYCLIGGAAVWLLMEEAGVQARTTKDLDIVLTMETMDEAFGAAFWQFVRDGEYAAAEKSSGQRTFYRFTGPKWPDYPQMLELFSRPLSGIEFASDQQITPIAVSGEVSSLSAILLDESCYRYLREHTRSLQGITVASAIALIPMKAKAWLDLSARKREGQKVDSRNTKKHRSDILRLSQLVSPNTKVVLPSVLREDVKRFLSQVRPEITHDVLRGAGIADYSPGEVASQIAKVFGLP